MIRPGIRRLLDLGRRSDREVNAEVALHIALRTEQLVRAGMPPEAARAEALRRFGRPSLDAAQRALHPAGRRRARRVGARLSIAALVDDLRYALRGFRREPIFAVAVVLTLALGIGANVTMYSVVDRLLLRAPAHVVEPQRLMHVGLTRRVRGTDATQRILSYPVYRDLRDLQGAFALVAVSQRVDLPLGRGADARQIAGMLVSATYFRALGVRPALGRFFAPEEDREPSGQPVVVVGYEYWQDALGGARDALGRPVTIGGRPYTIVGVAPRRFTGAERTGRIDVWLPITAVRSASQGDSTWMLGRQAYWLKIVARLAPGATPTRAATEALGALRTAEEAESGRARTSAVQLVSVLPREALAEQSEARTARLLLGVSTLVLLIACANTANLQLARTLRRRREIAVRLALGMGSGRLMAQIIAESVVLALIGGFAAIVVAQWAASGLDVLLTAEQETTASFADVRVAGFAGIIALLAGMIAAVPPAVWAARTNLPDTLKQGSRTAAARRGALRTGLALGQAALSAMLLAGAGLFVRSLLEADAIPLGIEADRVLTGRLNTDASSIASAERAAMYVRLATEARRMPDIDAAAVAVALPFSTSFAVGVQLPGRDSVPITATGGPYLNAVSPGFFETVGTRVLRGREFTAADDASAARVAIVNETTARLWWPAADAIGQCIGVRSIGAACATVVGVVEDAHRQTLLEESNVQFYTPLDQAPAWFDSRVLFLRTSGDPARIAEALRRRLQTAVPDAPFLQMTPMSTLVDAGKRSWRLGTVVFAAFGALAIVLSAVGLYGLLAYDVTQRTRELGVRRALGAQRSDLALSVLRAGVAPIAVGITLGILVTVIAAPIVRPLLLETSPRDPTVLAVVAVVLLLVAVAASLIPATRATRVDPAISIRAE
jgi:predicted permease